MASPEKKRKTTSTSAKKPSLIHSAPPQSTPISSLPNDLLLSCIARVSRLYYPTLSLVSKSFRSLIASPEFYQIRSSLGRTESCLYVYVWSPSDPNPRWFTLCKKPDNIQLGLIEEKKKKMKKSTGYVLAAIPVDRSRPVNSSGVVAIGTDIYNICGPDATHSSSVSILDCKSHTWREAPNMRVERSFPAANVLDGKIYVTGGCKDDNSSSWMEFFDPKTQTWESVSSSGAEICGSDIKNTAVIEEKLFLWGKYNLVCKPKEGKWQLMESEMDLDCVRCFPFCVIDNVLYHYFCGEVKWYDTNSRLWRHLKGVKGLLKFASCSGKMVDYDGKMAVFWDKISGIYKENMVWCAVIALERRNSEEIWGKVEWYDAVLSIPKLCMVYCALAPTV